MADKKKYIELLWHQKYDKYEKGEKTPIEKPNLPFQTIETINEPRMKEYEDTFGKEFYPKNEYPKHYPKDWENKLIWGDNKLVMSSLIKPGWAGKINLIYIDPPFFTGADFTTKAQNDMTVRDLGKRDEIRNPSDMYVLSKMTMSL